MVELNIKTDMENNQLDLHKDDFENIEEAWKGDLKDVVG